MRKALFFLVLLSLPALALSNWIFLQETESARATYVATAEELRMTTEQLRRSEEWLKELTTSTEAVEREARRQFRMIRPGEELLFIEVEE